ncbi:SET and MYND domain-containing protein 4-like [Mya arenaria]|uniref:SET and MYND domain-containing protein 4-like n=1 Tax=Mya arenaria TaxID=6604 RepID=UPI0022E2B8BC|nr:SET and MYND domain-containing protein 4-like [Mya arenaria]
MAAPIGNFQSLVDTIVQKETSKEDLSFIASSSDESEIFDYLTKISASSRDWVQAFFNSCLDKEGKSSEKAQELRNVGNQMFQRKQYKQALATYTKAIFSAPATSGDLALAYGNRSAALFRLSDFQACLSDIEAAIQTQLPNSSIYKLYMRKAQCLQKLNRWQELERLTEEIENVEIDCSKKAEIKTEIDKLGNKRLSDAADTVRDVHVPGVSYSSNPVLVQASSAVHMEFTSEKGRYLTATCDIEPGDTLIVERPYTSMLLPEHYPTHCHHCYVKLTHPYPCIRCSDVRYCSPVCARDSWRQYHQVECPYLKLLHSVGIAQLSLRIVIVSGLQFLLDFRREQCNRLYQASTAGLDDSGRYTRSYQTVYDLLTHLTDMTPSDVVQYALTAQLLLKVLQHSGWFINQKTEPCKNFTSEIESTSETSTGHIDLSTKRVIDSCTRTDTTNRTEDTCDASTLNSGSSDENKLAEKNDTSIAGVITDKPEDERDVELYIGKLLLRHILQLVCNAHAITEIQVSDTGTVGTVEESSQVRVATAIYPTASLMNHSCDPTIISSFHKDTLVVRSVKHVPKGGEIFNCYGPHVKRMSYSERQRCLKEQYFFTCNCLPCLQEGKTEEVLETYLCSKCEGPSLSDPGSLATVQCACCGTSGHLDTAALEQADQYFQLGVESLQQNKLKEAVHILKKCLSIRQTILHAHNRQLSETQDCLARCYATLGDFKMAADHLEASIKSVEAVYGSDSIELGNELQKLSEILISAQSWKQAYSANQRAVNIFQLNYGESHDSVKELLSAQKELCEVIKALNL